MAHSVKTNYILNLINTGSQMLFPLITFPYACRVIEADGIGQVNFFSSIIGYITLFTCLGIPMYAIREIARERDDVVKMNRTAIEILTLHTLLTLAGYIIVVLLCLFVPQIKTDIPLFLVLSLTIFFTSIGCEWFYQGIEDFKYITIRGLIVKIISCILLFVLVRTKDDLIYYGLYTVIGILGGNIFNFFRLRKYIHRENIIFSKLNIRRHLKPVLQVFSLNIVTSVYLQLNPVLLGFMKTTLAVGYFTAATKIMMMIMKLSSSLGVVMMPRLSNLIAGNKEEEFKALIQKSYDFTLAACLPLTAGLIFTAPYIISVLCGAEFIPAIATSQIIAPIILMVGISNVIGIQVLYPKGKINIVIKSCLIGAITDLILSVCLIPVLSHDGTAIAYLGAEIMTTVSMYFLAKEYIPIRLLKLDHLNYLIGSLIMSVVLLVIPLIVKGSDFSVLLAQIIAGIATYGIYLLIQKDTFVLQVLSKLKK
jgi:O-antigen/teichoic acid export membrane protein